MGKNKFEIDFEKSLEEKEVMQSSYVLEILIEYFKKQLKKNNCKKV